jgi:tetratricopeptide (TPR) repeat protein
MDLTNLPNEGLPIEPSTEFEEDASTHETHSHHKNRSYENQDEENKSHLENEEQTTNNFISSTTNDPTSNSEVDSKEAGYTLVTEGPRKESQTVEPEEGGSHTFHEESKNPFEVLNQESFIAEESKTDKKDLHVIDRSITMSLDNSPRIQDPSTSSKSEPLQLSEAKALKQQGVEVFRAEDFAKALEKFVSAYDTAAPLLSKDTNTEYQKEIRDFLITIANNISQTCINLNHYKEALDYADKALKLDSRNAKAYYRKGDALRKMGLLKDSLISFEFSDQFTANVEAKRQMQEIKQQLKELNKEKEPPTKTSPEEKEFFQKMWNPDKSPSKIQSNKRNEGFSKTMRNLAIIPFGFLLVPVLRNSGVSKNASLGTGVLTGLSCYFISLIKSKWLKGLLCTLPVMLTVGSLKFKNKLKALVD